MSRAELTTPASCPEQEHRVELLKWMTANAKKQPILRRWEIVGNIDFFKLFVMAPRQGKHGLWFLFKAGSADLTPEQIEWKAYLEMSYYEVHVVREWTEAARIAIDYLNLNLAELVVGVPFSSEKVDEFRRRRMR